MTQLTNDQQMKLINDLEIEMMADMYNRMSGACQKKCIPPKYKESDLSKGEAVCLDRCVAKYMEIHDRIGKKLTALSQKDEETMKTLQAQQQPKWEEQTVLLLPIPRTILMVHVFYCVEVRLATFAPCIPFKQVCLCCRMD